MEKDRQRDKERERSNIDTIISSLAMKGIGTPARVKVNTHTNTKSKKNADDELDDEQSREEEGERIRREKFAWSGGEPEVAMFFMAMRAPTQQNKKKFDITEFCSVLTTHRMLQVEGGVIVREMKIGPGSGAIISVPQRHAVTPANASPVNVALGAAPHYMKMKMRLRLLKNDAANVTESDEEEEGDGDNDVILMNHIDANGVDDDVDIDDDANDGDDVASKARRLKKHHQRTTLSSVSFDVPSADTAAYLQTYITYLQSTLEISQQLHSILDNPSSALTSSPYKHALLGWTMLLKSFIGPLVFGPLRLPLYTHQIKQLLARVQQMSLKSIEISSLKLLQFYLPRPELREDGSETGEDFIPSLSLRSFKGHPDHEYLFDVSWSCPSFLVRVEIQGKKIMSFKLEIEMRGIEVSGSVILKSSPYAPEKLAVSFASLPSLAFGVGSEVIVGSVKLPFQKSIEKIITTQIQQVLAQQLQDKIVYPKWVPIYFAKSNVSLLLDRWWSIAKFPFTYSKKDDEEMMGLALVVTTQAEQVLVETMQEMRERREQMEEFMLRPLYGEEAKSEFKQKEQRRRDEVERVKERQQVEEQERVEISKVSRTPNRPVMKRTMTTPSTISNHINEQQQQQQHRSDRGDRDREDSMGERSVSKVRDRNKERDRDRYLAADDDDIVDDDEPLPVEKPVKKKKKKKAQG